MKLRNRQTKMEIGITNSNKQQALNQLRIMQAWHEDFGNGPNADYDAICYAIGVIEAQPEELDTLIKALEQEHKKLREMQVVPPEKCEKCMMEHLDEMEKLEVELEMQKAQPEIIRCKDCENWDTTWENDWAKDYHYCPIIDGTRIGDWYCADAKRRTDE